MLLIIFRTHSIEEVMCKSISLAMQEISSLSLNDKDFVRAEYCGIDRTSEMILGTSEEQQLLDISFGIFH